VGTHWRLIYQVLNYDGEQIELCDADNAEYLDAKKNVWIKRNIDFKEASTIPLFGINVKVISKPDLIEYKSSLNRDVDIMDIEQLRETVLKNTLSR
jgi:predicted nucleotidyltransferase